MFYVDELVKKKGFSKAKVSHQIFCGQDHLRLNLAVTTLILMSKFMIVSVFSSRKENRWA
jgi:hypothetical protein